MGAGDVLAGESSADEVGALNGAPVDGGDVAQVGDVGPVSCQDATREGTYLGLPDGRHPGTLEAEVQAPDAGEEAPDAEARGLGG
jgi:hypothetical protein